MYLPIPKDLKKHVKQFFISNFFFNFCESYSCNLFCMDYKIVVTSYFQISNSY